MKKVLRIIGRLNVGGPAIHTVLLTACLDPRKFASRLVTGTEGPTEGSMRYLAEEREIELLWIPEMGREISLRDDFIVLWKLIRIIRREKPDIIHTHTAKAGTVGRIAALIALPGRKKQVYHTFHGHVFHSYFSPRKTRAFILIEQFLGRFTNRLIAVSDQTKKELVEFKIAAPDKIAVIPLGLDLNPFAESERFRGELRSELNLPAGAVLVGLVARLVPVKDIKTFLCAVGCIADSHPNAFFIVVGDGEMRRTLEDQASALGLGDRIRFLGYRQDLARIYADLDIVALSSLNEGLPVSLIEAMASGCVVLATSVGGVPNLIEEGHTGFLAPAGDPSAFADALDRILCDSGPWGKIGMTARDFVLQRFHVDRLVKDIEQLYLEGSTKT